jgi:hypothetical protein
MRTLGACESGRPCEPRPDALADPSSERLSVRRRAVRTPDAGVLRPWPGATAPSATPHCVARASACDAPRASAWPKCACGCRRRATHSQHSSSWIASRSPADGRALRLSVAPSTIRSRWLAWWIAPRAYPRGRGGFLRVRTLPLAWTAISRLAWRCAPASTFLSRAYSPPEPGHNHATLVPASRWPWQSVHSPVIACRAPAKPAARPARAAPLDRRHLSER